MIKATISIIMNKYGNNFIQHSVFHASKYDMNYLRSYFLKSLALRKNDLSLII